MKEGDSSTEQTLGVIPATGFRLFFVSGLAAIIGVVTGFIAFFLYNLISLFTNIFFYHTFSFVMTDPSHHKMGALVILLPVAGGLVIGLMARYGTSKIRGHGIPEAMEAVIVNRSRISPKVAFFKPLSAAIAIGTGGPFGAEGPIIQTGGAFGSAIGQAIRVTAAERKVLLACGAAAGMAATFSSPIAAVVIAIELLLFEFKPRSFIPLVVASTLATTVHYNVMGRGPMFDVGSPDFGLPGALPWYIILGGLCGLFAVFLQKMLYWIEDGFERLPFDPMWWPALGGLALGIIGFVFPRVFGVGFETISNILTDQFTWQILLGILIFKTAALLISLGSGTSGGLLAPTFMISAAMGASFAMAVNHFVPGAHLSPGAFALVAMGAVFGAASRATFAFIIFAFEITRDYNSVLPLMLVGVIATAISMKMLPNSIMTEKLARRGLRIRAEYEPDILSQVTIADVMDNEVQTIPHTMTVGELAEHMAQHHPGYTRHHALPVVNDKGDLTGIITRGDLVRALEENNHSLSVLAVGSKSLIVGFDDENLHDAVIRMLQRGVGRLPVVRRSAPTIVVGYLGREEVMSARLRRIADENHREPGWLASSGALLSLFKA
jgi:H+/Cl- antiporter ClcA